jgi:hypothetical protein
MDRQQRRAYFERLCDLRDGYGRLGSDDNASVITIEAMIERAIELLEAPGAPLIVVTDGTAQAA